MEPGLPSFVIMHVCVGLKKDAKPKREYEYEFVCVFGSNQKLFVFLFSLILVDFSILVLHVFGNFQLFFISYQNINKLSEKTVGLHSKSSKSNG